MHQTSPAATCGNGFDGPVDPAVEQRGDGPADRGTAEACAHALLRLVAQYPATMGRLRAARILGGFPVPTVNAEPFLSYAVGIEWSLRELTQLVDAVLRGGLMVQTPGARPMLVLTRAGHRALDALEHGSEPASPADTASGVRGTM